MPPSRTPRASVLISIMTIKPHHTNGALYVDVNGILIPVSRAEMCQLWNLETETEQRAYLEILVPLGSAYRRKLDAALGVP